MRLLAFRPTLGAVAGLTHPYRMRWSPMRWTAPGRWPFVAVGPGGDAPPLPRLARSV